MITGVDTMRQKVPADALAVTSGLRAQFEEWISGPPYELSIERHPDDPAVSECPGQYREIRVQIAFEAWMESAAMFQSCVAVATDNGTCRVFRTADGFRKWMIENNESRGLVLAWVDSVSIEP